MESLHVTEQAGRAITVLQILHKLINKSENHLMEIHQPPLIRLRFKRTIMEDCFMRHLKGVQILNTDRLDSKWRLLHFSAVVQRLTPPSEV